jgi:Mg2+-importing ATPase
LTNNNPKDEVNVSKLYGLEATLQKNDFIKKYHIEENGLSSIEAQERLRNLGLNEIKQAKPKKWYHYFLESLFTPFNCILLGIVAILFYTDVYLPPTPSYANILVIAILVTTSTLLDFFEEYRSNKAAEELKQMVATTTTVLRDGNEIQIPISQVTLGDIVLLSAGSMIPADLRIIEAKDLYVGQSTLTRRI